MIAVLIFSLFPSCRGRNDFSNFIEIPNGNWAYSDTITFSPVIDDSIADGELKVAVCHNSNYVYSNLWLEVSIPTGEDNEVYRDTIEMELADKYGHWKGQGFGSSFQIERPLPRRLRLHKGAIVNVRHIMRLDTLQHIEKVGVAFNGKKND